MNTRSFIKSLALLSGAAVGCPGIFIPKFESVRWKVGVLTVEQLNYFWSSLENWPDAWMYLIDPRTNPNLLGISHTVEKFDGDGDENEWRIITWKQAEGYPLVEIKKPTEAQ